MFAVVGVMISGCSFVKTDGQRSTAWNLGGRGTIAAPNVSTAYNNDDSLAALVDAARRTITAKVVVDGVTKLADSVETVKLDDNTTSVQRQAISAQEAVRIRELGEQTRQLQITAEGN